MRKEVAEHFADALLMRLEHHVANMKGKKLVEALKLSKTAKLYFDLEVVAHFDAFTKGDGMLALQGPGDLLMFLGYEEIWHCLRVVIVDGSRLKGSPKELLAGSNTVQGVIEKLDELDAVALERCREIGLSQKWKSITDFT